MCKSRAAGGKRCAAHSDIGVATTQYAKAVTDLDDAQISSVFHRTRRDHKDEATPSAVATTAALVRLRRDVLANSEVPPEVANRIAERYSRAIEATERGEVPSGSDLAAAQATVIEAEIAQRNLDTLIKTSARQQRKNPDRVAATFRKWRRNNDYEDIEAPDPSFRPNPSAFPTDKDTARALRKLGFENYLAQRLPVFTYGTLRANQANERLMNGAIASRSEQAHVEGVAIYGADRGFPYAQEAPDGQGVTKGDLVYLSDDANGDWSRSSLDNLEGFDSDTYSDSHYRRVLRDVTYVDPESGQTKTTRAWTYLAGSYAKRSLREEDRIHHGDWVQAKREYRNGRSSTSTTDSDYTGTYVVKKRAVDPTPPAPSHSAADAAAVFASAGLIDAEPDDNAGFWSTQNR